MIIVNNPFGTDPADINENTEAGRIGRRIRTIRKEKGMSQAELGKKMNLSADRIQKYENGIRKPKIELLKQFASVLGVETIALLDPVVENYIGAMYAFFAMEDLYSLDIIKEKNKYMLLFDDGPSGMNDYLKEWYEERNTIKTRMENATKEEQEEILKEYHNWQRTFPKALCDKTERDFQKIRIKNAIAELQEKLEKLEEE